MNYKSRMTYLTCPNCKCKIQMAMLKAPLKLRIKYFLRKLGMMRFNRRDWFYITLEAMLTGILIYLVVIAFSILGG